MESLEALKRDLGRAAAPVTSRVRVATASHGWDAQAKRVQARYMLLHALALLLLASLAGIVTRLVWGETGVTVREAARLLLDAAWRGISGDRRPLPTWLGLDALSALLLGTGLDAGASTLDSGDAARPGSGGLLRTAAQNVHDKLPTLNSFTHALVKACIVTAGCSAFRYGYEVVGGLPTMWELRLAIRRLLQQAEEKQQQQQPAATTRKTPMRQGARGNKP